MKVDPVRWLEGELPRWLERGLVSAEQGAAIRGLYGETVPLNRRLLAVVGALGALLTGAGIILLLAYNWDWFSRPARTAHKNPLVVRADNASPQRKQKSSSSWLGSSRKISNTMPR